MREMKSAQEMGIKDVRVTLVTLALGYVAFDSHDEFRRINSEDDDNGEDKKEVVQIKWKNPPTDMIKVNYDVTVDKIKGCIGFGTIDTDSEGFVLATWSTTKNILVELVVAESLAALHVVELSQKLGLQEIILEGDAVQIVNAIKVR